MVFRYFKDEDGAGIIGLGTTQPKAFEETALAMFNLVTDIKKIKPKTRIELECSAEDDEELLYEWLTEILREAVVNEMIFSRVKITSMKNMRIKGWAKGDVYKKDIDVEPTYEKVEIGKKGQKFFAKCIIRC